MIWTKEQLLKELESRKKVVIELGCGPNPSSDVIGVDLLPLPGVNYVIDLEKGLQDLPDNSVDEMISVHLMEHVSNFELLLSEIMRVLKPDGFYKVVVPHFSNPYFYSDYTHKTFFGLYTFDYFSKDQSKLKRKVPSFYNNIDIQVVSRKLVFKNPDFFLINLFRKHIIQRIFNINTFMQELYESSFCYTFPSQEIEIILRPRKNIT